MNRASEVIRRNAARLEGDSLLLLNPQPDGLLQELRARHPLKVFTQDFADYSRLEAIGIGAEFGVIPNPPGAATVLLFLPREKERLGMLLHACSAGMDKAARLWLVGENRAGIKSSPKQLKRFFKQVSKLDSARHCVLFEAREPQPPSGFSLDDYFEEWNLDHRSSRLRLFSLPGVFAHGRLDRGTALLLEALDTLSPEGRILDFACGGGVIALALLTSPGRRDLTLLDVSAAALESARRSLKKNGLEAQLLASDGLARLDGRFDWIISNPPFHRGVDNDYAVARGFFAQAGTFLDENGRILIVCNRHLPWFRHLESHFRKVEEVTGRSDFSVIMASGHYNRPTN